MKKTVLRYFIISAVLAVASAALLLVSGCTAKQYRVDYHGAKASYKGSRITYPAGAKVKLYYDAIASDTDYTFLLDGEPLNVTYDERKGYIITFTMPAHEVKLECIMKNSMEPDPAVEAGVLLLDYYQPHLMGNSVGHYQIVVETYNDHEAMMKIYTQSAANEFETCTRYVIPLDAVERCMELIETNELASWSEMRELTSLPGAPTILRFRTENSKYIRVSTELMPENGDRVLISVRQILEEYLKDEYLFTDE